MAHRVDHASDSSRPAARSDATVVDLVAYRCWTHRGETLCGCTTADDCLLSAPLPVHGPRVCCAGLLEGGWCSTCPWVCDDPFMPALATGSEG